MFRLLVAKSTGANNGQVPLCGATIKRSGKMGVGAQGERCGFRNASTTLSLRRHDCEVREFLA